MPALLTTDSIARSDRVDWWRDRVKDLFGAEYRIEPDGDAPFRVGVEMECAEPLTLLKIRGSAHHARGQSDSGNDSKLLVHLQIEGHCTVRAEGKETLLEPGSLSLFPVRESTDLNFHDAYHQVCAVLPVAALNSTCPDWARHMATRIPTDRGMAAVLADHLRSLAEHPDALGRCGSSTIVSLTIGLIGATLHDLHGESAKDVSTLRTYHLERIRHFALLHLANPALDVNFVASGVGLSARYIHRLFQNEAVSLMQWILKERLYRCHAELNRGMKPARSICHLAYSWGFNDQAHFTHSFRRQFGVSPSDVRNSGRKNQ
jgi:AraC-like DNA-binding protein